VDELTKVAQELDPYVDEERPEVKGPWLPVTRLDFDWAFERLSQCQGEADAVDEQYDAWLARVQKRRDELKARAMRGVHFFEGRIKVGAQAAREALLKGKSKTATFLSGSVSWRKLGGRLTVSDKDALNEWLAAQPMEAGLARVKLEPDMKAIQAHCKATGEVPPGCVWGEEYEEIYVKAEPPAEALTKGTP
jgi:phage host-nuclease inhibitor protein Gam